LEGLLFGEVPKILSQILWFFGNFFLPCGGELTEIFFFSFLGGELTEITEIFFFSFLGGLEIYLVGQLMRASLKIKLLCQLLLLELNYSRIFIFLPKGFICSPVS
ncbi:hypothetical protein TorRG33x02_172210, partial [Trema orientale]